MRKIEPHSPRSITMTTDTQAAPETLPESLLKLKEEARAARAARVAGELARKASALRRCVEMLETCLLKEFPPELLPYLDRDRAFAGLDQVVEDDTGHERRRLVFRLPGHRPVAAQVVWDGDWWRLETPAEWRWQVLDRPDGVPRSDRMLLGEALLEAEEKADDMPF